MQHSSVNCWLSCVHKGMLVYSTGAKVGLLGMIIFDVQMADGQALGDGLVNMLRNQE